LKGCNKTVSSLTGTND